MSNLSNDINLYLLCYELFISFKTFLSRDIQLANEITFLHWKDTPDGIYSLCDIFNSIIFCRNDVSASSCDAITRQGQYFFLLGMYPKWLKVKSWSLKKPTAKKQRKPAHISIFVFSILFWIRVCQIEK